MEFFYKYMKKTKRCFNKITANSITLSLSRFLNRKFSIIADEKKKLLDLIDKIFDPCG